MINEIAQGSQSATVSVEHTLATETGERTHVLVVDLAAMLSGDAVVLRAYAKVTASSSSGIAYTQSFSGAQAEPVFYSIPIPSAHQVIFTLEQTAGTGRAFPWSVITLD